MPETATIASQNLYGEKLKVVDMDLSGSNGRITNVITRNLANVMNSLLSNLEENERVFP